MPQSVGKFQCVDKPLEKSSINSLFAQVHGVFYIFLCGKLGDKIILLKDKADVFAAECRQSILVHVGNIGVAV